MIALVSCVKLHANAESNTNIPVLCAVLLYLINMCTHSTVEFISRTKAPVVFLYVIFAFALLPNTTCIATVAPSKHSIFDENYANTSASLQHGAYGLPVLCPWTEWTHPLTQTFAFLHPVHPNKGVQDALHELDMTDDRYLRRNTGVMWCDLLLTKYMKSIALRERASQISANRLLRKYLDGKAVKMDATLKAGVDLRGNFILGQHVRV